MKAVRFVGEGAIRVVEKAIPDIGDDEILVRIAYCGLCGSERGAVKNGISCVPGHEASGTVVRCGKNAPQYAEGSRVLIYLTEYCGKCEACRTGETNRCSSRGRLIGWHFDGGYEEYAAVPGRLVFPIVNLAPELCVLALDTIGTAFHALRQASPTAEDRVLIIGCGPIGLGCITILKNYYGVRRIIAADTAPFHLEKARELGAEPLRVDPSDTSGSIGAVLGCERMELVLEVCGLDATTAAAVKFVKAGGKVAYIGEPQRALHIPRESEWILKDFCFINSWYFPVNEIRANVTFIEENEAEVRRLITDIVTPEEMGDAYARFFGGETGKVLVRFDAGDA